MVGLLKTASATPVRILIYTFRKKAGSRSLVPVMQAPKEVLNSGPDFPIGYAGLSLGPKDQRGLQQQWYAWSKRATRGAFDPQNFEALHSNFDFCRNFQRIKVKIYILIIFKKSLI